MRLLSGVIGSPENRNRPLSVKRERPEYRLAGRFQNSQTPLAAQPPRIILTHLGAVDGWQGVAHV